MSPRLLDSLNVESKRWRRETGSDRVDLVGISQGGVIGLWYLNNLYQGEGVRKFLAAGAPLQGTWASLVGMPFLGAVSKGLRQLIQWTVYRGPYPSITTGRKGQYLGDHG